MVSSSGLAQGPASFAGAIEELDADHDRSLAAVRELQLGGQPAAVALRDAWPTLPRRAQRRALIALSALALDNPEAIECLIAAARSPDEHIREKAFDSLRRAGAPGWAGLVRLLPRRVRGDRAAILLARTDPDAAVVPLLGALNGPNGTERPVLRKALGTAVQRSDDDTEAKLRQWLETDPEPSAVAVAALALASVDEHDEIVARFIEYAIPNADDFPTTWRLLRSATLAGHSGDVDDWIDSQLETPKEWMLRQAAIDAVAARGRRTAARVSLDDPYPRVRARAARALSKDAASMATRATLARKDPWPMVRAEAVTSLRSELVAAPVIIAAVDDPMSDVRVAAIDVLARSTYDAGWDRVHARLRNPNEWPVVVAAALDYVMLHCRDDAVEALTVVVRRAGSPGALTDDINNAARAIEILRTFKTSESDAAVQRLHQAQGLPPTLKMALEQPLNRGRRCVPLTP